MMGGVGFIKDYPVEKFYRDAKIGEYLHVQYMSNVMTNVHSNGIKSRSSTLVVVHIIIIILLHGIINIIRAH